MAANAKKYNVELPGYTITNEDGTPFCKVGGVTYSNMSYDMIQVIQGMYVDFAQRLVAIGDAAMTPEQKQRHQHAMDSGVGKHGK